MATKVKDMAPRKKATEERDTVSVKLERELHRKLKMLALARNIELYEFLDEMLRPIILAEYKKLIRE